MWTVWGCDACPGRPGGGDSSACQAGYPLPEQLYFNGYVAKLQTPGGVVWFFQGHRGKPIVSAALFERIGGKVPPRHQSWAQASGIPVFAFNAEARRCSAL
jgi:hypothetical protein